MPSAFAQEESTCYELSAMNFHLGETPPRELWEREQTESATGRRSNIIVPAMVKLLQCLGTLWSAEVG
jgi:hypothetical protein